MHIHNDSLPSIGIRLSYSGFHGTVRYVGEVVGTIGTWIGIEWDDPKRGKHDGVKDGVRYFTCKVRNSGSFIRPSSHISYGHSFLEALSFKYIEDPHGAEEQVVLGSSKGAIVVDAVNLDKIREKFAQLDRLREVSLDEGQVARCDVPRGKIRQTCPSIRGLDLSNNLIANWEVVAAIAEELPTLDRLSLNRCRLQVPIDCLTLTGFRVLQSLHLNDTMMTWSEVQQVAARISSLRELQFGYNDLESLSLPPPNVHVNDGLQSLYLDSNQLADWEDLCRCLRVYPSLERLNLSSNAVKVIHHATHSKAAFTSLKHLFLSHNKLASWPSIDALAACCANLESLTLTGNTLSSRDDEEGRHSRQLTIAKIPTLRLLDGSAITTKERNDSERFYLTYVMQHSPGPEDERRRVHPRWEDLCNSAYMSQSSAECK
ncbi:RNI-like protein [Fistulina hepatica ATCC 64428]|nr:RNI-like protein [Fistulina hepatica ATCC 64428]